MKIIDLSVPMINTAKEPQPPKIEYESHEQGAQQAATLLGLEPTDLPDERAWATETVTLTTHTGTHVDAPRHYAPTSEGKKARTIDELPLEWCFSDGDVFDFSDKEPGYEVQTQDFREKRTEM